MFTLFAVIASLSYLLCWSYLHKTLSWEFWFYCEEHTFLCVHASVTTTALHLILYIFSTPSAVYYLLE